jgi:hypothetical protein
MSLTEQKSEKKDTKPMTEEEHAEMDRKYGDRQGRPGLRARRKQCEERNQDFWRTGAEAVVKEMQQLHDRSVMEPKAANMLTKEGKSKAATGVPHVSKEEEMRKNQRTRTAGNSESTRPRKRQARLPLR